MGYSPFLAVSAGIRGALAQFYPVGQVLQSPDSPFRASGCHLIGAAGGVEPAIPVNQLTAKIRSWKMYPRTMQDDSVEITSLAAQGLDDENLDWLVLSIKNVDPLPAHALKLRKAPVRVGETVFLIGCPYSEDVR